MKKLSISMAIAMFTLGSFAQVAINPSGTAPDPSAGLDVDFNDKGFLPPRMTTAQRDAISNPANGLVLYNTDTECLNYKVGGFWKEVCGQCTPQPPAADAGVDQTGVVSSPTTLAGNTPTSGTGEWTIISGIGGSIGTPSDPASSFSGTLGNTYVLRWTITNTCGTTFDEVTIGFQANFKTVFVTNDNVNGTGVGSGAFGGLAGGDNICQTAATNAGLSGTYKAWLSSTSESASSRLTHYTGEYRLVNGTKIADNWTDLTDGTLYSPINISQTGATISTSFGAWTNTNSDGSIAQTSSTNTCVNWTSSSSSHYANGGNVQQSNGDWTNGVYVWCDGSWGSAWKLYCFEQ